jgi:hypothetical protein
MIGAQMIAGPGRTFAALSLEEAAQAGRVAEENRRRGKAQLFSAAHHALLAVNRNEAPAE